MPILASLSITPALFRYSRFAAVVCLLLAAVLGHPRTTAAATTTVVPAHRSVSARSGEPVTVRLPGPVTDAVVGAGGRMIVFHLRSLQQLAYFDVSQSKVVRYQPLTTNDISMAAGNTHLFLGLRPQKLIQRWNLDSGEQELTVAAPVGGIGQLAMGAKSEAQLFLLSSRDAKTSFLINARTMQPSPIQWKGWSNGAWGPVWMNVSFDGTTAVVCGGGWAGIDVVAIQPDSVSTTASGSHTRGETLVSGNGRLIFPDQGQILIRDLEAEVTTVEGHPFPAIDPTWSLTSNKVEGNVELTIFANADPRRVATIRDLPELNQSSPLPDHKRIFLIPTQHSLVTVGPGSDHLLVREFRMEQALEDEGIDYLFVDSAPEESVSAGKAWRYDLSIRSRKGNPIATLQSAPEGMKLGPAGDIRWKVPRKVRSGDQFPVIVQITDDSRQIVFHTFRLSVH